TLHDVERRVGRLRATWLAFAMVLLLCACSRDPSPPPGTDVDAAGIPVTVSDSAGIPITLSTDVDTTYATLSPEPVVSLGGANAEGPTQFFRVTNVQLDEDGQIWVSDSQSGEVRVFHADGEHSFTEGRRGRGPGEFTVVRVLGAARDHFVRAVDQADGRLAIYNMHGGLREVGRLNVGDGASPRPFEVYPDGSILGQVPIVLPSDALEEGQLLPSEVRLMRFSQEEGPRSLVEGVAGPTWLWTGRTLVPIPFTVNAAFALRGDSLHLASGPSFRVRVYDGDQVVAIYGVDREPAPVTSKEVEAYRELVMESYPEEQHDVTLAALDHPEVPSVLPAYTRLVVSAEGDLWAGRYSPDTPWEVFDSEGRLQGGVLMPPDFYPMSIRDDRVAGVWRDELGVEYVRVYAVRQRLSDAG
ncbi:MAG: hypothetical protein PVI31_10330, partial [Gemmatimonadota bacterium]